jgi:hypothetical protein
MKITMLLSVLSLILALNYASCRRSKSKSKSSETDLALIDDDMEHLLAILKNIDTNANNENPQQDLLFSADEFNFCSKLKSLVEKVSSPSLDAFFIETFESALDNNDDEFKRTKVPLIAEIFAFFAEDVLSQCVTYVLAKEPSSTPINVTNNYFPIHLRSPYARVHMYVLQTIVARLTDARCSLDKFKAFFCSLNVESWRHDMIASGLVPDVANFDASTKQFCEMNEFKQDADGDDIGREILGYVKMSVEGWSENESKRMACQFTELFSKLLIKSEQRPIMETLRHVVKNVLATCGHRHTEF